MADAVYHESGHVRGDAKPCKVAGEVASEIKVGDFVYLASNHAAPVSEQADLGTLAQNQAAAGHTTFLGVALTGKLANETKDILVATEGVFRKPLRVATTAKDVGTLVGIEGTGTSQAVGLSNRQVVSVALANIAIGRLAKPSVAADLFYEFFLASTVATPYGGVQAPAA